MYTIRHRISCVFKKSLISVSYERKFKISFNKETSKIVQLIGLLSGIIVL